MTDPQAPEPETGQTSPPSGLSEELGELGKNLVGVLRAAWERPERQKLQQEIEGGLSDLGSTLRKEAKSVAENPVSQRIKTEVGDLGSRVRSGQVEGKVREELVSALHIVNLELQKIANLLIVSETETAPEEQTASVDSVPQADETGTEVPTETPDSPATDDTILETAAAEPTGAAASEPNIEDSPTTDSPAEA